jgi:hypothetical protein
MASGPSPPTTTPETGNCAVRALKSKTFSGKPLPFQALARRALRRDGLRPPPFGGVRRIRGDFLTLKTAKMFRTKQTDADRREKARLRSERWRRAHGILEWTDGPPIFPWGCRERRGVPGQPSSERMTPATRTGVAVRSRKTPAYKPSSLCEPSRTSSRLSASGLR